MHLAKDQLDHVAWMARPWSRDTEMIEKGCATLSDIAGATGFSSPGTFSRQCRKYKDLLPVQYRLRFGKLESEQAPQTSLPKSTKSIFASHANPQTSS